MAEPAIDRVRTRGVGLRHLLASHRLPRPRRADLPSVGPGHLLPSHICGRIAAFGDLDARRRALRDLACHGCGKARDAATGRGVARGLAVDGLRGLPRPDRGGRSGADLDPNPELLSFRSLSHATHVSAFAAPIGPRDVRGVDDTMTCDLRSRHLPAILRHRHARRRISPAARPGMAGLRCRSGLSSALSAASMRRISRRIQAARAAPTPRLLPAHGPRPAGAVMPGRAPSASGMWARTRSRAGITPMLDSGKGLVRPDLHAAGARDADLGTSIAAPGGWRQVARCIGRR